jgi:hypothetical protein
MTAIIHLDSPQAARENGNLFHNHPNQLRRAVGFYTVVHFDRNGGTVRDVFGQCWDWWPTDEVIAGTNFTKIHVMEAI